MFFVWKRIFFCGLLLTQVLAPLFYHYFFPYMLQVLVPVSLLFISYQTCLLLFFSCMSSLFSSYIGEQRNISSISDLLRIFSFICFIADIPFLLGPSFISCHACPYLLGVSSKFILNFMTNPDFAGVFIPNLNHYRYEKKTNNALLINIAAQSTF